MLALRALSVCMAAVAMRSCRCPVTCLRNGLFRRMLLAIALCMKMTMQHNEKCALSVVAEGLRHRRRKTRKTEDVWLASAVFCRKFAVFRTSCPPHVSHSPTLMFLHCRCSLCGSIVGKRIPYFWLHRDFPLEPATCRSRFSPVYHPETVPQSWVPIDSLHCAVFSRMQRRNV